MSERSPPWLHVEHGEAPLILSLPHAGVDLMGREADFVSAWLARRDADWHIPDLYDFGADLGATIVRTDVSRSIIDVNRDPSGASLYPGQATTELCPTTSFDGEPLYRPGEAPNAAEIANRKQAYFAPYEQALNDEVARLRRRHDRIVLYDCHSIRSSIPRLFDGELPEFNLGTNSGASADPALTARIVEILRATGRPYVVNGRFKGGWITRNFGKPEQGVHAVQMEMACRAYLREPAGFVGESNWPPAYDADFAAPAARVLRDVLVAARDWAAG